MECSSNLLQEFVLLFYLAGDLEGKTSANDAFYK